MRVIIDKVEGGYSIEEATNLKQAVAFDFSALVYKLAEWFDEEKDAPPPVEGD